MTEEKPKAQKASPVRAHEIGLPPLVRLQWKKMLRLMVAYAGDTVLDAQCMEGTMLRRLERVAPGVKLCGACFTPPQLRHARQLVRRADIMFADERDFPWINESMDVAFISRGFHELENPMATLREMHRLLRKGGQMLVAGVCLPQPLRALYNYVMFGERTPPRVRSKAEMAALLRNAGFEQIHIARVGLIGCVATGLKK